MTRCAHAVASRPVRRVPHRRGGSPPAPPPRPGSPARRGAPAEKPPRDYQSRRHRREIHSKARRSLISFQVNIGSVRLTESREVVEGGQNPRRVHKIRPLRETRRAGFGNEAADADDPDVNGAGPSGRRIRRGGGSHRRRGIPSEPFVISRSPVRLRRVALSEVPVSALESSNALLKAG